MIDYYMIEGELTLTGSDSVDKTLHTGDIFEIINDDTLHDAIISGITPYLYAFTPDNCTIYKIDECVSEKFNAIDRQLKSVLKEITRIQKGYETALKQFMKNPSNEKTLKSIQTDTAHLKLLYETYGKYEEKKQHMAICVEAISPKINILDVVPIRNAIDKDEISGQMNIYDDFPEFVPDER
jgi:hypothetical protein